MSPDAGARTFGRTAWQTARGTLLVAALGLGAVALLSRYFARSQTPLGALFQASRLPPELPLVAGCVVVLGLSLWAWSHAARSAERFCLDERGLEVRGWLGTYRLDWENVAAVGVTEGGSLGIRVRRREALLETHAGTDRQREWLRTLEPYGEWDYLFTRADLGVDAHDVREWMRAHLEPRP